MKTIAAFGVAIAACVLAPAASAQSVIFQDHAPTARAMLCLLEHAGDRCQYNFGGNARRAARPFLYWSPNRQFDFGTLVSATYAGTQLQNAHTTNALGANAADVYYVKYRHQDMTFYIVPPDRDGNILYMLVRGGTPTDAKSQPTGLSRIR
jgi:hypothetical protein